MIRLLLFLLLTSCSTAKKGPLVEKALNSEGAILKKVPLNSEEAAKRYIHNQRNFLKLLFEQSRDPYYGTPKWSEECLKENKIGDIDEDREKILLVSELYFNKEGNPGLCPGSPSAKKGSHIILYCKGDNLVLDVKLPGVLDLPQSFCH